DVGVVHRPPLWAAVAVDRGEEASGTPDVGSAPIGVRNLPSSLREVWRSAGGRRGGTASPGRAEETPRGQSCTSAAIFVTWAPRACGPLLPPPGSRGSPLRDRCAPRLALPRRAEPGCHAPRGRAP